MKGHRNHGSNETTSIAKLEHQTAADSLLIKGTEGLANKRGERPKRHSHRRSHPSYELIGDSGIGLQERFYLIVCFRHSEFLRDQLVFVLGFPGRHVHAAKASLAVIETMPRDA
ncbi:MULTISPECIES: hypothetical protein [Mesorhizobium]|uniref:hypothetical protein n=1 Tax=Mesorhizobium TaxID=68287 RepID=UPI001FDA603F|nr:MULTISPECIES: hypothetical protein [Mesorhizobium]WJI38557.1 hypothetical protein NL534_33150 [Mesorhizobium opportunistum]